MKAVNVLLALVVSAALALGVLEGGLRLLGMGPQPTINRFDADLGWVKTPGAEAHRKTREFDITFRINSLGLRDDEMSSPAKTAGAYRVLALGDSFVLGSQDIGTSLDNAFVRRRIHQTTYILDLQAGIGEVFVTNSRVNW